MTDWKCSKYTLAFLLKYKSSIAEVAQFFLEHFDWVLFINFSAWLSLPRRQSALDIAVICHLKLYLELGKVKNIKQYPQNICCLGLTKCCCISKKRVVLLKNTSYSLKMTIPEGKVKITKKSIKSFILKHTRYIHKT